MQQLVSITSQGQLTIPKAMRDEFGLNKGGKAVVRKNGRKIIVEPKGNFWSLKGILPSKVSLSDRELRKARERFAKQWAHR